MGDSHIWAMGHSLSAVLYTTARNKMKNMEYAKKKKKERERDKAHSESQTIPVMCKLRGETQCQLSCPNLTL